MKFIPYAGSSGNKTNSHSAQQTCFKVSRKRRREEPNEMPYKQMKTFHQGNSQQPVPQVVSFDNEEETNLSNPRSMSTFSYINAQEKKEKNNNQTY